MNDPRDENAAKRLARSHAWPRGCRLRDVFVQRVRIADLEMFAVGLVGSVGETQLFAAAADPRGFPVARARFELIERASILLARARRKTFALRDQRGALLRTVNASELFPIDPEPKIERTSLSNGVALHRSWTRACEAALAELVERDRVLRSFRGEFSPRKIPARIAALRAGYEVEAYAFGPASLAHRAVGLFLFPREPSDPLVYGFAAARDAKSALAGATREALQRLAFLHGEALPKSPPRAAATPDYHQAYYLYPPHRQKLRRWLARRGAGKRAPREIEAQFVDLTPPDLAGGLKIVRALSADALPLQFGGRHLVHPIV
ncbi:MAG TPA: YcaO-like family protein [Polyangiales bacterium]|jgi:hypothetical protein